MKRNKVIRSLEMLLVTITAFIYAIMPMTSFAYVEKENNVDEEGIWEVINADSDTATVAVTMYMMMQPEYAQSSGFRGAYQFWCEEGVFQYADWPEETSAMMQFFFRPDNANVVDVYDDLQVWLWEFNIEPGIYEFMNPNGLNHVGVLTQSLDTYLMDARTYNEGPHEQWIVKDGDSIRLYALFGDEKSSPLVDDGWITNEENVNTLIAYAHEKEESFGYGAPVADAEEQTTIEVEQEPEKTEKEETVSEQQKQDELEQIPMQEEVQVQKADSAENVKETNGVSRVVILIICVVIAAGVFIAGWIKKHKENVGNVR